MEKWLAFQEREHGLRMCMCGEARAPQGKVKLCVNEGRNSGEVVGLMMEENKVSECA